MRLPGEGCVVFVDRDGTVNREVAYLSRARDLELLPGAAEALQRLRRAGYRVVVVSNQSGVARGYFTLRRMKKINRRLRKMLRRAGVKLDGLYACPWHEEGRSGPFCRSHPWRKPAPGMLLEAARRFGADLTRSWMIGDRAGDIQAGQAAGCRTILVRTGYGMAADEACRDTPPEYISADLADAADLILREVSDV